MSHLARHIALSWSVISVFGTAMLVTDQLGAGKIQ